MKATAAVLLTAQITPAELAVSGVMIGAILLLLGLTGWITRLARLVPQSVLAGLQLGRGFALALLSLDLIATAPLIAVPTLAVMPFPPGVAADPAVPTRLALATQWAL